MEQNHTVTVSHFRLKNWKTQNFRSKRLFEDLLELLFDKLFHYLAIEIISFLDLSLFEIFVLQQIERSRGYSYTLVDGPTFFDNIKNLFKEGNFKNIRIKVPGYIRNIRRVYVCKKILVLPPGEANLPYSCVKQHSLQNKRDCHFKYVNFTILGRLEVSPIHNLKLRFCRINLDNVYINGILQVSSYTKIAIFNSVIVNSTIFCDPNSNIRIHNSEIRNSGFRKSKSYKNTSYNQNVVKLKTCKLEDILSEMFLRTDNCHFIQKPKYKPFRISGKGSMQYIHISRTFCFSKNLKYNEDKLVSDYKLEHSLLDINKMRSPGRHMLSHDPRYYLGRDFFGRNDETCNYSLFLGTVIPKEVFIRCIKHELIFSYLSLQSKRLVSIKNLPTSIYVLTRYYFVTNYLYGSLEFDLSEIEIPDFFKCLTEYDSINGFTSRRKYYQKHITIIYIILYNLQDDIGITFTTPFKRDDALIRINLNFEKVIYQFFDRQPIINSYIGFKNFYLCSNWRLYLYEDTKDIRFGEDQKERIYENEFFIAHGRESTTCDLDFDERTKIDSLLRNKNYRFYLSNEEKVQEEEAMDPRTYIKKYHPEKYLLWINDKT